MKLVEFIIASSLLTLIPGPDILFVLTQSILHGKRAGISVALGLCSGLFFHTAAAALGLSLIIASQGSNTRAFAICCGWVTRRYAPTEKRPGGKYLHRAT